MPEDLKVSQIGSSPLPPPLRGLHSPGVKTILKLSSPVISGNRQLQVCWCNIGLLSKTRAKHVLSKECARLYNLRRWKQRGREQYVEAGARESLHVLQDLVHFYLD